jgi:hypothetical protein
MVVILSESGPSGDEIEPTNAGSPYADLQGNSEVSLSEGEAGRQFIERYGEAGRRAIQRLLGRLRADIEGE